MLMVFEDAHWIDPTSRELLDLTVDRVRRLPVLLADHLSSGISAPLGRSPHVTTLALNRLGERDGEALVQAGRQCRARPEIVAEIVERTDGVPLFVEELTKAVLESAAQGDRVAAVLATASLGGAIGAGNAARLADGAPRPARPGAKERADRRGARPRFAYELIEPVRSVLKRSCKSDWMSLARPGSCSAAVPLRTPPICSSTRWCRTLPTRPCCAGDGNATRAPRRHWKRNLPIWSRAPARTACPPSHGRRRYRARDRAMVKGGTACNSPLG